MVIFLFIKKWQIVIFMHLATFNIVEYPRDQFVSCYHDVIAATNSFLTFS